MKRLSPSTISCRTISGSLLAYSIVLGIGFGGSAARANTVATDATAESAETTSADAVEAAEDAGGAELLVTARRREEGLQDVPIPVSAVSGTELAEQHLDRIGDYTVRIPNFTAIQQNTRVSGLYVRGVGGNASNDGAEGGVGLIVDNVFFTHVGFSWLDFVDLESVEVVRGPQGTLLGKKTTVGAVIVRTARPSFDPSFSGSLTVANRDRYQLRVNGTGSLIDDVAAFRITLATDQGGGWIRNAYDGTKLLDASRWSVRGQLLVNLASNVTTRVIAERYESREYNNFYPPVGDVNTFVNLDGSFNSARAGSWSNTLQNRFGYAPSFDAPNNADLDTQQRLVAQTTGLSNELNWDFGGAQLTSVSAWRRLHFRPHNDTDYSPFPILRYGFDVDVDQYSQELRLASTGARAVDWTIGAYYLHEDLVSDQRALFYGDAARYFLGAGVPGVALDGLTYSKRGSLSVDSLAGFGQVTVNLSDRFSVTGGLRYSWEKKAVDVVGSAIGGTPLTGALSALLPYRNAILASFGGTSAADAGVFQVAAETSRDSIAWLINPAFRVTDDILLYGLVSYGEKSGAANTTASPTTLASALTDPERSTSYEVGARTTWLDGALTVNLNLYRNDIKGYQAAQIDPNRVIAGTVLANVGSVRLQGFELETALRPARGWTLGLNLAHNDAKYRSYENAPAPIEFSRDPSVVANNGRLSLTGYQVQGAPRWTLQGNIAFETPINSSLTFTGYATAQYRSAVDLSNPRSLYGHQEAYTLVHAGIGLQGADKQWSLQLWSKNLFNRRYWIAYGAAAGTGPGFAVYGEPRTFGLTLSGRI